MAKRNGRDLRGLPSRSASYLRQNGFRERRYIHAIVECADTSLVDASRLMSLEQACVLPYWSS